MNSIKLAGFISGMKLAAEKMTPERMEAVADKMRAIRGEGALKTKTTSPADVLKKMKARHARASVGMAKAAVSEEWVDNKTTGYQKHIRNLLAKDKPAMQNRLDDLSNKAEKRSTRHADALDAALKKFPTKPGHATVQKARRQLDKSRAHAHGLESVSSAVENQRSLF
jgi:hypothetical protein